MKEGKTDEQILAELGAMTGMASEEDAMTPEKRKERDQKVFEQLESSLTAEERQQARDRLNLAQLPGQDGFDEFTTRHSEMRYDADDIIQRQQKRQDEFEDWKQSLKTGDLKDGKVVHVRNKPRSIEPEGSFG